MLLCGVHLLPDLTGALVWPKQRLLVLSDPLPHGPGSEHTAMAEAGLVLRDVAALLRQRQPTQVIWLGGTLPALLAADHLGRRENTELARITKAYDWTWIAEDLSDTIPGRIAQHVHLAPLTFRLSAQTGMVNGEISASPWPMATLEGQDWPCFICDGRRLVIPPFAARHPGTNVLAPPFQPLFRRPFHAVILAGGRIVTRPRAKLG